MVFAQRVAALQQYIVDGHQVTATYSYSSVSSKFKAKVNVSALPGVVPHQARPFLFAALQPILDSSWFSVVVDRGHTYSDGHSCASFWIEPHCTNGAKQEIIETAVEHNKDGGNPGSRVDEEAFAGTASTSAPFMSHAEHKTECASECLTRADAMGEALMDTTAMLGTPEFHGKDDPIADVPLVGLAGSAQEIEKDDWRYGTWAGLQMVISNFQTILGGIEQLGSRPEAPTAFLQDAQLQCQALLGIAHAQVQKLLDNTLDIHTSSKQDITIEMERGRLDIDRLMTRCDDIWAKLKDAFTGELTGRSMGSASGAACCSAAQPSAEDISATQRLMSPKSGKPQKGSKKPAKRPGAPALGRNSDGKHMRR